MSSARALVLRAPLPAIHDVDHLGVKVTYQHNGPVGSTTALLHLPNKYIVVMVHTLRHRWAVISTHYVVPGTGVFDPRPVRTDPRTGTPAPSGVVWEWNDGTSIGATLRDLAPLKPAPEILTS